MTRLQSGITLLESLVALLVLSIGLLGTAHMMATGLKQTNGSFARTQAIYIAENLAERMRANPEGIENMNYAGFDSNTIGDCTNRPAPYCETIGGAEPVACTAAQLAVFDQYQATCGSGGSTNGSNGVKDLLPAGRIQIICEDGVIACTPDSTYTIIVSWNETEQNGAGDQTKTKHVQHKILP